MGWGVLEDQRLRPVSDLDLLNGHEWAKRQCEKAGIGYTALDNGFRDCTDPVALQRICDRLGPGAVKSFFWRWVRRLPSPFTARERTGIEFVDVIECELAVHHLRVPELV